MNKVMKTVGGFLYRVSGLERLVSAIQTKVLNYKLRLRMIPVSYKVFISLLNVVIGASGMYVYIEAPQAVQDILGATTVTYVNTVKAQEPERVEEVAEENKQIDLVDFIFLKESSRGVNNYSKCEAIGKYNRYGYGIPGDGTYLCFDKDDDTKAVEGWVIQRRAEGLTDNQLLCKYNTGKATETCNYIR